MKPNILSEMTGKTHGIKFKMSPPRKTKNRKVRTPREGAWATAHAITGDSTFHAARSFPLACWENTIRPSIDNKLFGGDSIGIRKVISSLLRASIFGWPTTVFPGGSGKKSTSG